MKKLIREPLVHFLLLGAVIFGIYGLLAGRIASGPKSIVVTQGRIDALVTAFTRTWMRPPTARELDGLIHDYVREEACVREATALGLDKDDTFIRRHLRQKLEFVSEDLADRPEPSDPQLQAWLAAHPDEFRTPIRLTFEQIYFKLGHDPGPSLARLRRGGAGAAPAGLGDPLLVDYSFQEASIDEVERQFGKGFAAQLAVLPVGEWQGPVESAYGQHLVRLTGRTESRLPGLEEVRDAIRRQWEAAQRQEAENTFYRKLLEGYTVTIEKPAPSSGEKKLAQAP
jgi:hypothetical protein